MTTRRHLTDHVAAPPRRAFSTPVRGSRFQTRPATGAPMERATLALRHEPDNPADPHAVAVWADSGGRPWRIGYLERAVAVRVADRLRAGDRPSVRFAGWWDEPAGRWQRPVVRVDGGPGDVDPPWRQGVRSLPPCSIVRRGQAVSAPRPAPSASPGPAAPDR